MFNIYKKHCLHSLSFYLKRDNDIPPDQPSFRYAIYFVENFKRLQQIILTIKKLERKNSNFLN